MPFESGIIRNTISWPEILKTAREDLAYGRESIVWRPSSAFFAFYNPREMIEFGWNPDFIDYTSTYISSIRHIKKPLLENFRVVKYEPADEGERNSKRDFDAYVSSMYDENLVHKVNVGNLHWKVPEYRRATEEDIFDEFLSFLIYKGDCTCGAVSSKGKYCSMPEDYFMEWHDAPLGEYDRILSQSDERKPYGNLVCKHQAKVLVDSGTFPHMLNKMRFYHFFPDIVKSLRLNYRKNLRIKDLDEILLPHMNEISFGLIPDYIKNRASLDKRIEQVENEVVNGLRSIY